MEVDTVTEMERMFAAAAAKKTFETAEIKLVGPEVAVEEGQVVFFDTYHMWIYLLANPCGINVHLPRGRKYWRVDQKTIGSFLRTAFMECNVGQFEMKFSHWGNQLVHNTRSLEAMVCYIENALYHRENPSYHEETPSDTSLSPPGTQGRRKRSRQEITPERVGISHSAEQEMAEPIPCRKHTSLSCNNKHAIFQ